MSALRQALHSLSKRAPSSAVIVATLAVAIGAATIVFGTIDMVWRIVPIADRSRFVIVKSIDSRPLDASGGAVIRPQASIPDLVDWSRAASFEALTALTFGSATMSGVDVPIGVSTAGVTT